MSNVIAAIGLAQVEKADEYREMRINNNAIYKEYLADIPGIILQKEIAGSLNVCWMNAIVIDTETYGHTRDELIGYLREKGIETRLLFNGMHHQKALKSFGCNMSGNYPVCDWLNLNGLYLPSASNLSEEQIKLICSKISEFQKIK
jgi:perosamine synthetase